MSEMHEFLRLIHSNCRKFENLHIKSAVFRSTLTSNKTFVFNWSESSVRFRKDSLPEVSRKCFDYIFVSDRVILIIGQV